MREAFEPRAFLFFRAFPRFSARDRHLPPPAEEARAWPPRRSRRACAGAWWSGGVRRRAGPPRRPRRRRGRCPAAVELGALAPGEDRGAAVEFSQTGEFRGQVLPAGERRQDAYGPGHGVAALAGGHAPRAL